MRLFSLNRPERIDRKRHRLRPKLDWLEDRFLLTAGDLDTTFGSGGVVLTSFPSSSNKVKGTSGNAFAVQTQADGKIVAAGWGNGNFAVSRYNANGSLDSTFGSGGKVVTTFVQQLNASAFDLAIQQDGKIVVVGNTLVSSGSSYGIFAVARYNTNGTLDTSFGSSHNGLVTTRILGSDTAKAVVIQSDGKILVAGSAARAGSSNSDALVRYNASGTLDTSFGQGGIITQAFVPGASQMFIDVALESVNGNTEIIAAGPVSGSTTSVIARYGLNGSLDTSFGTGGSVILGFTAGLLAVQPDGKIVDAGRVVDAQGVWNVAAARLNVNGSLDTTFNPGGSTPGVAVIPGSDNRSPNRVALQADGKIVIGGFAQGGSQLALARLNPADGSLDSTFGTNGLVVRSMTGGATVKGMALQSDGKIVTAGMATVGSQRLLRHRPLSGRSDFEPRYRRRKPKRENTHIGNLPGHRAPGLRGIGLP